MGHSSAVIGPISSISIVMKYEHRCWAEIQCDLDGQLLLALIDSSNYIM